MEDEFHAAFTGARWWALASVSSLDFASRNALLLVSFGGGAVRMATNHQMFIEEIMELMKLEIGKFLCVALCKSDKVYGAASEDMDLLTFAAPRFPSITHALMLKQFFGVLVAKKKSNRTFSMQWDPCMVQECTQHCHMPLDKLMIREVIYLVEECLACISTLTGSRNHFRSQLFYDG